MKKNHQLAQVNAAFLRDVRRLVWAVDSSMNGYSQKDISDQPILKELKRKCEIVERWLGPAPR